MMMTTTSQRSCQTPSCQLLAPMIGGGMQGEGRAGLQRGWRGLAGLGRPLHQQALRAARGEGRHADPACGNDHVFTPGPDARQLRRKLSCVLRCECLGRGPDQCPHQEGARPEERRAAHLGCDSGSPEHEGPGRPPSARDVLVLIDGDRTSEQLVNLFGMGHARRKADKGRGSRDGKTIARSIILNLQEKSVKARKFRRKTRNDFVNCFQRAHIFYNASTKMSERAHLHFPDTTNMSNSLGPFTLQPYEQMPLMTFGEKKIFWGHRRRAVGGPAEEKESDKEDDVDPEEGEELPLPEIELPGVGQGNSVLQPVSFHSLPPIVPESLAHSVWAIAILDLTPGAGDLMKSAVLAGTGYLGMVLRAKILQYAPACKTLGRRRWPRLQQRQRPHQRPHRRARRRPRQVASAQARGRIRALSSQRPRPSLEEAEQGSGSVRPCRPCWRQGPRTAARASDSWVLRQRWQSDPYLAKQLSLRLHQMLVLA